MSLNFDKNPISDSTVLRPAQQQPWQQVDARRGNNKTRKRLSENAPYNKGTCTHTTGGINLGYSKPAYLQNKALVISRFHRDVTKEQFQKYVNDKAERHVNFLYIQRLDKPYSSWGTVVVELSDVDYTMMSKLNFWLDTMQIRDWKGWRFWRGDKPIRIKPEERKNMLRSQWATEQIE